MPGWRRAAVAAPSGSAEKQAAGLFSGPLHSVSQNKLLIITPKQFRSLVRAARPTSSNSLGPDAGMRRLHWIRITYGCDIILIRQHDSRPMFGPRWTARRRARCGTSTALPNRQVGRMTRPDRRAIRGGHERPALRLIQHQGRPQMQGPGFRCRRHPARA